MRGSRRGLRCVSGLPRPGDAEFERLFAASSFLRCTSHRGCSSALLSRSGVRGARWAWGGAGRVPAASPGPSLLQRARARRGAAAARRQVSSPRLRSARWPAEKWVWAALCRRPSALTRCGPNGSGQLHGAAPRTPRQGLRAVGDLGARGAAGDPQLSGRDLVSEIALPAPCSGARPARSCGSAELGNARPVQEP